MTDNTYSLTGRGLALYEDLLGRFDWDYDELAIVVDACRTLMLIDKLQDDVADAPIYTTGAARQQVVNPLYGELRQQRQTYAALRAKLCIPETDADGNEINYGSARSDMARKAARARWGNRGA